MCDHHDEGGDQPPKGGSLRFTWARCGAGHPEIICTLRRMPLVREITGEELGRMHELDVSEVGGAIFLQQGSRIDKVAQAHQRSWRNEEEWLPEVRLWQSFVSSGGTAFGAFDAEDIIGVTVLRTRLTVDTDQLAALYVDRAWRRHGVATALVDKVVELARKSGALNLYVSASRSESAVSFYLARGFTPVAEPHQELFRLEPYDIHLQMAV
jgi:GNAT superfamily N-acetyltransferase